jgi:hypothetical protein
VSALAIAEAFLRDTLASGPTKVTTLWREAAKTGIKPKTLEQACKALGIVTRRVGFGPHGYVEVELPW